MRSRNQSLDVLRGVAVLLVMGHHHAYYKAWHRGGGIGVDLFFVLSGFLISGLLFAEYRKRGTISISRFLIRRGFKIYPAYYFFVLVLLPFSFRQLKLADLTFMGAYFPAFWGHNWSLSVEEHFYFCLPLLLILSCKLFPHTDFSWIPRAFPVTIVVCLLMRIAVVASGFAGETNATHLRIDALFAGVTIGWFYHFCPGRVTLNRKHWLLLPRIGLGVLPSFCDLPPDLMRTAGYTASLLGFACLVLWALNTPWLGKASPLARIGVYSYSIYLWHWPVALFFQYLSPPTFWAFWSYMAAAIAVGVIATLTVEAPLLKIRDRHFPTKSLLNEEKVKSAPCPALSTV